MYNSGHCVFNVFCMKKTGFNFVLSVYYSDKHPPTNIDLSRDYFVTSGSHRTPELETIQDGRRVTVSVAAKRPGIQRISIKLTVASATTEVVFTWILTEYLDINGSLFT